MDTRLLKRLLLARVFELRRNEFKYRSLDEPQSVTDDVIQTPEGPKKRRRVVLTAHGCSVATCSMCPLPDEAVKRDTPVTLDHWMAQIKAALSPYDDVDVLTLFHNGNYFNEREVPSTWRMAIHDYLRTTRISELVVESLPQFIPAGDGLFETALGLRVGREDGGIKLTVAIGLQSSSDLVRELCIMSTCRVDRFKQAVEDLRAFGFDAQVFLMFGAPFLTTAEAMHDLRESIRFCHDFGITPTVCPLKVAPNTIVDDLVKRGLYDPPGMRDLYATLRETGLPVRVAASLFPKRLDPALREAFVHLNRTGEFTPGLGWGESIEFTSPRHDKIVARIERYLLDVSCQEP